MNLLGEIRRRARHIVGPVMGITLFAYFTYHVVQGDRGLIAWLKLSQQVETAQDDYDRTVALRKDFEHRVSLLNPRAIDPDMLDERVRSVLGLAHPDDIIIMTGTAAAAPPLRPLPAATPPEPAGTGRRALDYIRGIALTR